MASNWGALSGYLYLYEKEDFPDRITEDMPDRLPKDMPDRMAEEMPDRSAR